MSFFGCANDEQFLYELKEGNIMKKYFACYIPEQILNDFQRKYPRLATLFVQRAMLSAIRNKDFFNKVFFETVDDFDNVGKNNPGTYKKINIE